MATRRTRQNLAQGGAKLSDVATAGVFIRRLILDRGGHPQAVAFLGPETAGLFTMSEQALMAGWNRETPSVVILLPWRSSPTDEMRDDGPVCSFLCTLPVWDKLADLHPDMPPESLCFGLLWSILNEELSVQKLLVRQLPHTADESQPAGNPHPAAALLMAHGGTVSHLRTALAFLGCGNSGGQLRVRVGLDFEDASEYRALAALRKDVEFFRTRPAPAGPYVIRQKLAEYSNEPLLVFHDSDDVSCSDRLASLGAELAGGCDMAGCHEVRVDEIAKEARAMRFPLDVSKALKSGPHHALLHSTAMIRREAFFAAGGFATNQMISGDTQFLLRAYFHVKIRNADRFLYIRRRHSSGLTVRPETALGSPLRRQIERPWSPDFEMVKNGQLELRKSTLQPEKSRTPHEIIRFCPEER